MDSLTEVIDNIVCKDLVAPPYRKEFVYSGELVSILMNNPELRNRTKCQINIYRSKEISDLSKSHFYKNGKKELSLNSIVKYLELGGINALTNKIEISKVYKDLKEPLLINA